MTIFPSGSQLWGTVPRTKEFRDSVPGTENFPGHGPGPVPTPGGNYSGHPNFLLLLKLGPSVSIIIDLVKEMVKVSQ